MDTEQALLTAIWADPHDDLRRLVYADWLDETGTWLNRGRAELIRVQCALATADDGADRRALRAREDRLLKSHRQTITKGATRAIRRAPFSRGFPVPLACWSRLWKTMDAERLAAAPLWQLPLGQQPGRGLDDLFERPEAQRLGRLIARSDAEPWVEAIVRCPHLRNVSRLELEVRSPVPGDRPLAAVAASSCLPSLRELHWSNMPLTEAAVRDLAHGPLSGRLRGLGLHAAGLTPRLVGVLSESPLRTNLRELSIREANLGDTVAKYLVQKGWKLHRLSLTHSNLTDEGLECLAAWPGLADVEYLDLGGNAIGHGGGRALANSPYLKCSPHCSVRMSPDVIGYEWAFLLDRLGPNATLAAFGHNPTDD